MQILLIPPKGPFDDLAIHLVFPRPVSTEKTGMPYLKRVSFIQSNGAVNPAGMMGVGECPVMVDLKRDDPEEIAENPKTPSDWQGYEVEKIVMVLRAFDGYFKNANMDHSALFDELHLENLYKSDFSKRVIRAVLEIPSGDVRTYKELGDAIGSRAYRAIGNVLRNNPVPVIVPCHRIVSAAGIGGFMGKSDVASWEVSLKRRLLYFEGALRKENPV